MKHRFLRLVMVLAGALCMTSCSDFLDTNPTGSVSDKLIWSKAEYAELNINSFYHIIDALGQFDTAQTAVGLSEGMTDVLKYGSDKQNVHMWFANELSYGNVPASTAAFYLGNWGWCYGKLASLNQALSNLHEYKANFSEADYVRLMGEVRFFRGFIYFELMKRYKEIIIYDYDMQQITANKALSSEKAGWDFVEDDLNFAAESLPEASATGRLTKWAALALQSRAMLYAERWDKAAKAAKEVIDEGGFDLTAKYADAWSKTKAEGNTESILEYEYNREGVTHNFDDNFTPGGDPGRVLGALGNPTQEMVECYELATGGLPDWSKWHTTDGTTEIPPYALLEPRFAATILYNGSDWKGRKIEPFEGGVDGFMMWRQKPTNEGKTVTGYFLRKLVDESHDLTAYSRSTQPWIAIRYAEVLLNYAEASAKGSDAEGEKNARTALNEVRERVGLPKVNKKGDALLEAIYHERKVELAYEGQYYWDMRRLKLAHTAFSNYRTHGLAVEKLSETSFKYTYIECDDRTRYFEDRLYRVPLPQEELDGNEFVDQYKEWR
ncbi:MAG: RagB/SusD family nutrient uptake outer membrane protein [Tidjanibacter sp.]|nr:RagB/SusD family nutrient uptake outer membrane protein [Tidjanibacter sp.]